MWPVIIFTFFFDLVVEDAVWNKTDNWNSKKKSQNQSLSSVYEHLIEVVGRRWKRAQTNVPCIRVQPRMRITAEVQSNAKIADAVYKSRGEPFQNFLLFQSFLIIFNIG